MSKLSNFHVPNALRGLLAAMTAEVVLLIAYPLFFRLIAGYPIPGAKHREYVIMMIIFPLTAGFLGGIVYGTFMKNKTNRFKARLLFWIVFWACIFLIWTLGTAVLMDINLYSFLSAGLSLFLFTGIWSYLMETILKNPMIFDGMSDDSTPDGGAEKAEPNDNALIRKRKGSQGPPKNRSITPWQPQLHCPLQNPPGQSCVLYPPFHANVHQQGN